MRILLSLLLLSLAAQVNAQSSEPDDPSNRELVQISAETVRAALQVLGAGEVPQAKPRADMMLAQFPNGSRFILRVSACTTPGSSCRTLSLVSFFELPPGLEREKVEDVLFDYAADHPFVNLSMAPDGHMPKMSRDVVGHFGVPRGNLYVELVSFSKNVEQFRDALKAAAKP